MITKKSEYLIRLSKVYDAAKYHEYQSTDTYNFKWDFGLTEKEIKDTWLDHDKMYSMIRRYYPFDEVNFIFLCQ